MGRLGRWGLCFFLAGMGLTGSAYADDPYQTVFQGVDRNHLEQLMKDMTGYNPVTVNGETFSIRDRYLPSSKANYRKYWKKYFQDLGLTVNELNYESSFNIEPEGHNLEVVLPGRSPDSVVIIVHYDSMGPHGSDNEAVDDDMTGMATLMETARILTQFRTELQYTVRFVAADYEEWGGLEGARYYANYLKQLSTAQNFHIVAGIDNEQSGWKEGANLFDVFDCGGATNSRALGAMLIQTATQFATIGTTRGCMGENSDHYALWEIGVPAVVFSEHHPFNNPHFDHAGGDTYARIDKDYYFKIAQIGIVFAAKVVGIGEAVDFNNEFADELLTAVE